MIIKNKNIDIELKLLGICLFSFKSDNIESALFSNESLELDFKWQIKPICAVLLNAKTCILVH